MWHIQPRGGHFENDDKKWERGGKNWTPIFQAYLTPKLAKKNNKINFGKNF